MIINKYNGKEYTSREIYDIYDVDYELYDLLNEGLNKEINDDLGQVYVELVDVRDKIAELNGYENYALYADCELYNRDYTVDDLNKFLRSCKKIWIRYYLLLLHCPYYNDLNINVDELIDNTMNILTSISPYIDSAYSIFNKNHL